MTMNVFLTVLELYDGKLFSDTDPMNMFGGRVELRPQSQAMMRYFANFVKTGYGQSISQC